MKHLFLLPLLFLIGCNTLVEGDTGLRLNERQFAKAFPATGDANELAKDAFRSFSGKSAPYTEVRYTEDGHRYETHYTGAFKTYSHNGNLQVLREIRWKDGSSSWQGTQRTVPVASEKTARLYNKDLLRGLW